MTFKKDYNTLLNEILTEYQNLTAEKITQGSVLYVKATVTASVLWGLYQSLDRAARQAFVTTADSENKIRHAAEYGITVTEDMTDADIVNAVLNIRRNKFAGGNRYDYEAWAQEVTYKHGDGDDAEVESVIKAKVESRPRGEGTFDIVIEHNRFFEGQRTPMNPRTPSPEFIEKIRKYIEERRPVGSGFSWGMRICPVEQHHIGISINYEGDVDETSAKKAVADYVMGLDFDDYISHSAITRLMYEHGADLAIITQPSTRDFRPSINKEAGSYWKFYAEPNYINLTKLV